MWELAISCLLIGDLSDIETKPATEVECREVDDLARKYRIQVYNTFRTDRDVYDQWAARGSEVLQSSRLLSPQSPQQAQLAQWFQSAAIATQSNQALPDVPHVDISQIATHAETGEAELTQNQAEIVRPDESTTEAEPETETQPVSTAAPNEQQSSLPWGAVGRVLFGTEEEPTDASEPSDSSSD